MNLDDIFVSLDACQLKLLLLTLPRVIVEFFGGARPIGSQRTTVFFKRCDLILNPFDPLNRLLMLELDPGRPRPGLFQMPLSGTAIGTSLVNRGVEPFDLQLR